MTNNQQEFAYGQEYVGDVGCPVVQAGFRDRDYAGVVGNQYDRVVREKKDVVGEAAVGTVSEEVAREAWTEALEKLKERYRGHASDEPVRLAREISWRLEWIDDGE